MIPSTNFAAPCKTLAGGFSFSMLQLQFLNSFRLFLISGWKILKPDGGFRYRIKIYGFPVISCPRRRSARVVRRSRTVLVSMAFFTAQEEPITSTSFLPRVIAV